VCAFDQGPAGMAGIYRQQLASSAPSRAYLSKRLQKFSMLAGAFKTTLVHMHVL
jgi:hypothetical protein